MRFLHLSICKHTLHTERRATFLQKWSARKIQLRRDRSLGSGLQKSEEVWGQCAHLGLSLWPLPKYGVCCVDIHSDHAHLLRIRNFGKRKPTSCVLDLPLDTVNRCCSGKIEASPRQIDCWLRSSRCSWEIYPNHKRSPGRRFLQRRSCRFTIHLCYDESQHKTRSSCFTTITLGTT